MTEYNEAERELLRQAKAMREIFDSKAWNVYSALLESQIQTRADLILNSPAGSMSEAETERIKGARLGLMLALDNVKTIIGAAKEIVASHQGDEEESGL